MVSATIAALVLASAPAVKAEPETWTFEVGGVERTALVARPSAGTGSAPVVIAFHGRGGSSRNFASSARVAERWPEAWTVYPQGLPTPSTRDPEGKSAGWDNARPPAGSRDLAFVDALLDRLAEEPGVDARRIFAMGHSNGGAMTYGLWAARADRFAGFAPSAAAGARGLAVAKPAFLFLGDNDEVVDPARQRESLEVVRRLNGAGEAQAEGRLHRYPGGTPTQAWIHDGGHRFPSDAVPAMVAFFRSVAP